MRPLAGRRRTSTAGLRMRAVQRLATRLTPFQHLPGRGLQKILPIISKGTSMQSGRKLALVILSAAVLAACGGGGGGGGADASGTTGIGSGALVSGGLGSTTSAG